MTFQADELQPEQILPTPRSQRWLVAGVTLVALLLALAIAFLKISALYSWRYTSDLFTIDLMLQETLRGHFGLEFTYGRQLGDHACLILFALLPFKLLLGKHMVVLLILLPAIAFAACGIILFRAARDVADTRWAAIAAALYFFSIGAVRGPFEFAYGFHIDTLAGYVAVAMAALLMRAGAREQTRRRSTSIGAILAICIFCLLKEEMALLGIIFFLVLLLTARSRLHLIGLLISICLFIIEMIIIRISRCPWNRTNEALVQLLTNQVRQHGFFGFFFAPEKSGYWLAITTLTLLIAACALLSRRLNPYAAALTFAGLAKLAFSWFVKDFDLWTWHNYPGIVMLTGALALQSLELRHLAQRNLARTAQFAIGTLLALSIAGFMASEIPYFIRQTHITTRTRARNEPFMSAMTDITKQVNPRSVAAVPPYSAIAWTDGHRYTFFPKGVTASPRGIADYIVVAKNKPLGPAERKAFKLIYHNRRYQLYARKGYLPGEQESRELFIRTFGRSAIGPMEKRPAKKPPTTTSP